MIQSAFIITPTRNRPQAFELLLKYITPQIVAFNEFNVSIRWIVVNDGDCDYSKGIHSEVRRIPKEGERHSLCENILCGLSYAEPEDVVVIVEDDDYYAPHYLDIVLRQFRTNPKLELFGTHPALYYNLGHRVYKSCKNAGHASLAQSAVRGDGVDFLRRCARAGKPMMDLRLWEAYKAYPTWQLDPNEFFDMPLHVSMKSLPGEKGIGMGHRPERYKSSWTPDPDLAQLEQWIGADVELYRQLADTYPNAQS